MKLGPQFEKLNAFVYEIALGAVVFILGLVLIYKFNIPGIEQLEKIQSSLVTIGGTLIGSGLFRMFFTMQLTDTSKRLFSRLERIDSHITNYHQAMQARNEKFFGPGDVWKDYKYFYWKTIDKLGHQKWLASTPLIWEWRPGDPWLFAQSRIDDASFFSNHQYTFYLARTRGRIVLIAERVSERDGGQFEKGAVYVHTIPLDPDSMLFGFGRHQNMDEKECLSPCILSRDLLNSSELEQLWMGGRGGGADVQLNVPTWTAVAKGLGAMVPETLS
jgi:hypothetical protein